MAANKQDQSFSELVSSLTTETSSLFRQEIQLARAEVNESISQAMAGMISMVAGALIAFAALLVLLQALVVVLANYVPPALAALIVGVVVALIAFGLVQKGRNNLKTENLWPRRVLGSLRRDKAFVKEQLQ